MKNTCTFSVCFIALMIGVFSGMTQAQETLTPAAKNQLFARASSIKLPKGTEVTLNLVQAIDSRDASVNEVVELMVYANVIVDNEVVIATNLGAFGTITEVTAPRSFGRPASVTIQLNSVQAVDGQLIRLQRLTISPKGKSRKLVTALGVAGAVLGIATGNPIGILLLGAGLMEKGTHFKFGEGQNKKYILKIAEDVMIKG